MYDILSPLWKNPQNQRQRNSLVSGRGTSRSGVSAPLTPKYHENKSRISSF